MALTKIGVGATGNDGTGDPLRTAFGKTNTAFDAIDILVAAATKNNSAATIAPTSTDDSASGYAPGSVWLRVDTGEMWRCRSATAGAASWIKVDTADFDTFAVGNYYSPFGMGNTASGSVGAANVLRLAYGVIKTRVTIDQLGYRCQAAAGNIQLCVYKSLNGRPTGLPVAQTASVATTAASVAVPLTAATVTLEPGSYWWGAITDAAPTIYSFALPNAQAASEIGSTVLMNILSSAAAIGRSTPATFGAGLPDMTSATLTDVTAATVAALAFRVASVP